MVKQQSFQRISLQYRSISTTVTLLFLILISNNYNNGEAKKPLSQKNDTCFTTTRATSKDLFRNNGRCSHLSTLVLEKLRCGDRGKVGNVFPNQRNRSSVLFSTTRNKPRKENEVFSSSKNSSTENSNKNSGGVFNKKKLRLYVTCCVIVLLWVATGTLFYSYYNNWPLAQSFFYAVDAGMSIGFCTDVAETTVGSRAFTVIYILLGASCVGGALALFVQDIMEGIVDMHHGAYEILLAKDAFQRMDKDDNGMLSLTEFKLLVEEWTGQKVNDDTLFNKLYHQLDLCNDGYIHFEAFRRFVRHTDKYLNTSSGMMYSDWSLLRIGARIREAFKTLCGGQHRIFFVLVLWITMGISWGIVDQGWDVITATHFAISALATGGLTAPPTDSNGILPAKPAIFCGVYCLFGIPLFALALAHFARVLVESHVTVAEQAAITKPLDVTEFEFAKHLCSKDGVIHMSDFIVLQLLRQGKVTVETVDFIKKQFDSLDVDRTGVLNFDEATRNNIL